VTGCSRPAAHEGKRLGGAAVVPSPHLGNRALALELAEPARKLSLSADAALLAVDLLERARGGAAVHSTELRSRVAALDEIPWLVCANTFLAPALAAFVGERPVTEANVFGDFFARVLAEVDG
jgi:hypothetical protein